MKTRLAALLGFCAVASLACGPAEESTPSEPLRTQRASLHRALSDPNSISHRDVVVDRMTTSEGLIILISTVHRTPSGGCAMGTGPIGSPGYMSGMMADINRCDKMCPGGAEGYRAAEDGSGGCKLQCNCKNDGLGFIDAPPEVLSSTP